MDRQTDDRQTGGQTDDGWLIDGYVGKQTDRQKDRQMMDRQIDRQIIDTKIHSQADDVQADIWTNVWLDIQMTEKLERWMAKKIYKIDEWKRNNK